MTTGLKKWKCKTKLRLSAGYCIVAKYATALPTSLRNFFRGFYHFNSAMSTERESWRERWYDKVGPVPEIVDDKDESDQPAWWALKKEVANLSSSFLQVSSTWLSQLYKRVVCCTPLKQAIERPESCVFYSISQQESG